MHEGIGEAQTTAAKREGQETTLVKNAQEVHLRPISFFDASREQTTAAILAAQGPVRSFVSINAHALYLAEHDPEFLGILRGSYRFCDGFGVHLLAMAQGLKRPVNRTTPTDFMWLVFEELHAAGKTVYCLGDEPGVAETFSGLVNARHPGLVTGCHHGFFAAQSPEEDGIIAEIDRLKPHLLCVGMGQPRQEKWVERLRDRLSCPAAFHIGASMAFAVGARRRGPRWATDNGLEWLFRVLHEPRKMFSRYFVEIPWLMARAFLYRAKR